MFSLQVEDAVSRAADGTSAVQDLDFSSLRSQLGPLAAVSVQNCISLPSFSQVEGDFQDFLCRVS